MAFGKNLSQKDAKYTPQPNNYCGGFAMSAILTDSTETDTNPMKVYDEIQRLQQDVDSGPLFDLVKQMQPMGGGTNICLPSSLVKMAQTAGFVTNLKYSELLQFTMAAIKMEVERCGVETAKSVEPEDIFNCFSDLAVKYYLVLVNSGHWIAMKRKSDNTKFSVYDPGTGDKTEVEGKDNLIAYLKSEYSNVEELIIMLKR